jgi:hypothetical protein
MADETTTRLNACPQCGEQFNPKTRRGAPRKYCTHRCAARASSIRFRQRHKSAICSASGCSNRQKNTRLRLCSKHEARLRRGGKLERRRVEVLRRVDKRGYVMLKRPQHVLADRDGWCYEHRLVAYEACKGEEQRCYWCATPAPWATNVIDHLDEDRGNNDPSNLVVACNGCNRARGAIIPFVRGLDEEKLLKFIETLHLMRKCNLEKADKPLGQLRLVA